MRTYAITDRAIINKVITSCKTCYLALVDEEQPYVLPMNFALDGENIILHSAQSGRMWDTLLKNPNVCINWTLGEELAYQDVQVGCSYRVKSQSVNIEGTAEIVEDFDEKVRCLEQFMKQYSGREFKFSEPAVKNVGIIKVPIDKISAKEFGAKAITPWNS